MQTNPKYSVHILEGSYKDRDTFYSESRVRECPQTAPTDKPKADIQTPDEAANPPAQPPGDLKVGSRVDVYLTGGQQGKNRGTIVETKVVYTEFTTTDVQREMTSGKIQF